MKLRSTLLSLLILLISTSSMAQVSAYTFSSEVGIWQPLNGGGSLLGMPGMAPPFNEYDDNSFVTQGESILLGTTTTGNGWPIGFIFNFNGQPYDRVGLSIEGWLAFGQSSNGQSAVFVPAGAGAYTPLSSPDPAGMDPLKRNRIAAFAMDLAAQGQGGTWPLQLKTSGQAPNRSFTAEWNVVRSGGSNPMSFQIRLNEGGGVPAQQTVQVIYGNMTQSAALLGQVGLGGTSPADFNNRSVVASPYDWMQSLPGATNTANCRLPATSTDLPQGLTFTWTPAGCLVSGIVVTDLAMNGGVIGGTLSWAPLAGAANYSYIITAGGPTAPVILSGTGITGSSVALSGLPAGQELFAYVKADCAGATEWGSGHPFTTANIVEVICGEPAISSTHCYGNLEETTWRYSSSSGEPLRLFLTGGAVASGDLLRIFDGNSSQAPLLFSSASGAITGQVATSIGPEMTMVLTTDANGSCVTQNFILPIEWAVGCMDCTPIQATFQVVDDCADQQFGVVVNIFSMGSATSAQITNSGGVPVVTANGTGSYTVGPFPIGTPVIVSAENTYNPFCSAVSEQIINGACPVVSCGPDEYTYCYTDNDNGQWAYQAVGTGRIGIRFLAGTLATGDLIRIYNGLDPFMSAPLFSGNNGGDLTNLMVSTTANNIEHAFLLEAATNSSASCATGQATPWKYVVACYDGCTAPAAAFTVLSDCDQSSFTVSVDVSSLGSASTVSIVNDGGASAITANATGTYLVGPFNLGDTVVVDVQGSSVLCTVNSVALYGTCGVGVNENAVQEMHVFPNPGTGVFRMVMPDGFNGRNQLAVVDIAGRKMEERTLQVIRGEGLEQDLSHLPAGRYTLILTNGAKRAYAPISIIR